MMARGDNDRQLTFDFEAAAASAEESLPSVPGEPSAASSSAILPAVEPLSQRLQEWAQRGVFLGTSSWKYPGWQGRLYNAERYATHGKYSERKFNDGCLAEYARVFPAVCGDFSFYQFPAEATWAKLFAQLPVDFQMSVKVPEEITVERFADLPRYGPRAGKVNGHFLDAGVLQDQFLARLEPYADRVGPVIFQFGTFHHSPMAEARPFAEALAQLLDRLPEVPFRFAVEVRNPSFLSEEGCEDYLSCLRAYGVSHCLNSWTRMPAVAEQLRIPGILTANHVVARFLLRPGRAYAEAVEQFAPYDRVQEPYPAGREALKTLIETCVAEGRMLYAFVNNRFEGNAIDTIEAAVPE